MESSNIQMVQNQDKFKTTAFILDRIQAPQYLQNFKEHFVDDELASTITIDELREVIGPLGLRKRFIMEFGKYFNNDINLIQEEQTEENAYNNNHDEDPLFDTNNNNNINDFLSIASPSVSTNDSLYNSPVSSPQIIVLDKSEVIVTWDFESIFQNFEPEADSVLNRIQATGILSLQDRKIILTAACMYLKKMAGSSPSAEMKQSMAASIYQTIPNIPAECWYSKQGKGKNARGWLEHRIGNSRQKVSKTSASAPNSKLKRRLERDALTEEEVESRRKWLKDYREPEVTVSLYLNETFWTRRKNLEDSSSNISIKMDWPCLLYNPHMVVSEFDRDPSWKSSSSSLYDKWQNALVDRVILYGNKTKNSLFEKLDLESELILDDERKLIASFMILPFIFNNGFRMENGKYHRISNRTSLSFFMDFQKVGTNIDSYAGDQTLRTQPFVLLVGSKSKLDFQQFFVIAENKAILCASFVQAVDICFKIYRVLNAEYPTHCKSVWEFLDGFIYALVSVKNSQAAFVSFLNSL